MTLLLKKKEKTLENTFIKKNIEREIRTMSITVTPDIVVCSLLVSQILRLWQPKLSACCSLPTLLHLLPCRGNNFAKSYQKERGYNYPRSESGECKPYQPYFLHSRLWTNTIGDLSMHVFLAYLISSHTC